MREVPCTSTAAQQPALSSNFPFFFPIKIYWGASSQNPVPRIRPWLGPGGPNSSPVPGLFAKLSEEFLATSDERPFVLAQIGFGLSSLVLSTPYRQWDGLISEPYRVGVSELTPQSSACATRCLLSHHLGMNQQIEQMQMKYTGTGHPDVSK